MSALLLAAVLAWLLGVVTGALYVALLLTYRTLTRLRTPAAPQRPHPAAGP